MENIGHISSVEVPTKKSIIEAIKINLDLLEDIDNADEADNIIGGYIQPYLNQLSDITNPQEREYDDS